MIDPTCSSDRVCRVASDGLENATRQAQAQDRFGAVLDNPDLDGAQMLEGLLSLSRHA
jgi:hypothetical protein